MIPRVRVVLIFLVTLVAAGAAAYGSLIIALSGGLFSGTTPQSAVGLPLTFILPFVIFLAGASLASQSIRASFRSPVTATVATFAFALFPVYAGLLVYGTMEAGNSSSEVNRRATQATPVQIGIRIDGVTHTEAGDLVNIELRLHPIVVTKRITEYEIRIDSVFSKDWSVVRVGPHRGFVRAGLGTSSWIYDEEHSGELLRTEGDDVIVPFSIRRVTPGAPLPAQVIIDLAAKDPLYNNDVWITKKLDLPWAHPSASL